MSRYSKNEIWSNDREPTNKTRHSSKIISDSVSTYDTM